MTGQWIHTQDGDLVNAATVHRINIMRYTKDGEPAWEVTAFGAGHHTPLGIYPDSTAAHHIMTVLKHWLANGLDPILSIPDADEICRQVRRYREENAAPNGGDGIVDSGAAKRESRPHTT